MVVLLVFGFVFFSLMFLCIRKLQEHFVRRSLHATCTPLTSADPGLAPVCVHSWFVQVALCL